jgi:hypothetical protein
MRALVLLAMLAACGQPTSQQVIATAEADGRQFAIVEDGRGGWQVMADQRLVACLHPTVADCQMSLLHHMRALEDPELGS